MSDVKIYEQAFNLLCDEKIGHGMSRTVFSSKLLPRSVIKTEDVAQKFQNVIEWETWQRVKDTAYSRWFAECQWISTDGSVLIMERTQPATPAEYPVQMPRFLTDFKRRNYGISPSNKDGTGKRWLVCHDYGTHLLFEHGMSRALRKAHWTDGD